MADFAKIFKQLRLSRELSQSRLAECLGFLKVLLICMSAEIGARTLRLRS